jgi:hypothetical protein
MRLVKIANLINRWSSLRVYEEIDKESNDQGQKEDDRDSLLRPYIDVKNDIWLKTVVLSWRWGKDKPHNLIPGFTPMTDEQWEELRSLLDRAMSSAGMEWVWIDWCCIPQYSEDSNSLMVEIMRSKVCGVHVRVEHYTSFCWWLACLAR